MRWIWTWVGMVGGSGCGDAAQVAGVPEVQFWFD
jgi:hypothetical protein